MNRGYMDEDVIRKRILEKIDDLKKR